MSPLPSFQQREDIFDAATRIKQLTQQPSDFLTDLLVQQQQFACIQWICHFKILSNISLPPRAAPYAEVARNAGVPEATLRSVARMAMTANFLGETTEGHLSHNSLSAALVEDPNLLTWLSYMVNRTVPCMAAFVQATEKWPNSTKGNETAYNIAMKTELPFFDHLKSSPELGAEFGAYMKSQASVHSGASVNHLLHGFDWQALGKAKVVDVSIIYIYIYISSLRAGENLLTRILQVGGGGGDASIALAKEYPQLHFVIQDLAHSGETARAKIEALPENVARRLQFQEHDFFTAQPVTDGDVYLLRMIIHDWPDADAVKILRNLVHVMKAGSRLVIMDMVLPAPGSGPRTFEAALRQKDLTMKQVLNAREREVEDWSSLIHQVDSRLKIVAIRRPEGSQHSIIEISR